VRPATDALEFRILGPLQVWHGDQELDIGGTRTQTLLAALLLRANEIVPADRLVDQLWGEKPPASARATLRTHVSHLRARLSVDGGAVPLFTKGSGYGIRLRSGQLDADRFRTLVDKGLVELGEGHPEEAAATLGAGLDLWRGPVLGDLGADHFALAAAGQLAELRLAALEARIEADLALGRHATVIGELERLVADHPLRETLTGQLMLALYRSGRQADALAVHSTTRRRLVEELGLEPGPALRDLESAILAHDDKLELPETPSVRARIPSAVADHAMPALLDAAAPGTLVGRSVELAVLRNNLHHVEEGSRQIALVSGEAGVGKTRLAAELAVTARSRGALVLAGQCDRVPLTSYQPFVEALRSHLPSTDATTDAEAGVHGLAGLSPRYRAGADEVDRYRLFESVDELLGQLAATDPVVLVLDDLHWADPATLLLFHHLARSTTPARVLIVALFRPQPHDSALAGTLAELRRSRRGTHVDLAPLGVSAVAALVEERVGAAPPSGFVHDLRRITDGNPFFVEEVVAHLVERGALDPAGRWPDAATMAEHGTPEGVQEVIRGRLSGLDAQLMSVLRAAAVLGRYFEFTLMHGLVGFDEEAVLDAVEEALRFGLFAETGQSWSAGYSFRHELLRQTVYEDISVARRQRLHRKAADLLSVDGIRAATAAETAFHLEAAGAAVEADRLVEASLAAADAAEADLAWEDAARHVEAALAALARTGATDGDRAPLAERAGRLISRSNIDHGAAVAHFETALRGFTERGDAVAMARVHSGLGLALSTHPTVMDIPRALDHYRLAAPALSNEPESVRTALLHLGRGAAAVYGLRTDEITTATEAAMRIALGHDHRPLWCWAAYEAAWAEFNQGRLAASAALHQQVWDEALGFDDAHLAWMAAFGAALHHTMYLGRPVEAAAWCRRGLALPGLKRLPRQRISLLDQLGLAVGMAGHLDQAQTIADELGPDAVVGRMLAIWHGDWPRANELWSAALDHDTAAGDRLDAVLSACWLGRLRRRAGWPNDAVAAIEHGLAMAIDGPQLPGELMLRAEAARLAVVADRLDDAVAQLVRCDEILASGEVWGALVGHVQVARAALWATWGDRDLSEEALAGALDLFRRKHLPWMEADAHADSR
jgi:DNA-binding SARP family transcriptional activator